MARRTAQRPTSPASPADPSARLRGAWIHAVSGVLRKRPKVSLFRFDGRHRCGGQGRLRGRVVGRTAVAEPAGQPVQFVPAFDPLEDCSAGGVATRPGGRRLARSSESEERLGYRVGEGGFMTDACSTRRSRRSPDPRNGADDRRLSRLRRPARCADDRQWPADAPAGGDVDDRGQIQPAPGPTAPSASLGCLAEHGIPAGQSGAVAEKRQGHALCRGGTPRRDRLFIDRRPTRARTGNRPPEK